MRDYGQAKCSRCSLTSQFHTIKMRDPHAFKLNLEEKGYAK